MLDLACGSGEMLCTWRHDHQMTGIEVDISSTVIAEAHARADALGVAERVTFVHGDAAGLIRRPTRRHRLVCGCNLDRRGRGGDAEAPPTQPRLRWHDADR